MCSPISRNTIKCLYQVLCCACMLYVQYCPVLVCCMYSIILWLYVVCTVSSCACMLYVQYCPVLVCCMYSIVLWLYAVLYSIVLWLYVVLYSIVLCLYAVLYSIVLWLYVVCTILCCGCMLYVQYSPPPPSLAVQGRLSWQSRWISMSTVRQRRPSLDWTCPSTSRSMR